MINATVTVKTKNFSNVITFNDEKKLDKYLRFIQKMVKNDNRIIKFKKNKIPYYAYVVPDYKTTIEIIHVK